VDLLYANTMLALTQHINQHTLAQEEKALPRQALIFLTLRRRVKKAKQHSHQNQRINGYPISVFNKNSTLKVFSASLGYPLSVFNKDPTLKRGKAAGEPHE